MMYEMKAVSEMPTEGQFVAIWEYGGRLWSSTFRWDNGELFEYTQYYFDDSGDYYEDGFYPVSTTDYLDKYDALYFVPV